MSRNVSDRSSGGKISRNSADRMSDHAPLIYKEILDIESLWQALEEIIPAVDHDPNNKYNFRTELEADAVLVSRKDLNPEEKGKLDSTTKIKSEYCLLRCDKITGMLTSEFDQESFYRQWQEFLEASPDVAANEVVTSQIGGEGWQDTIEQQIRRELFRDGRITSVAAQEASSITDAFSLWNYIKPEGKLTILGEDHGDTTVVGAVNKLVTASPTQFQFCFVEMLHSMHQPFVDRWINREIDDEKMSELLMYSSARGEANLGILQTLREHGIRPIALNINLQTESEFDRGGSQTDIRQEGGDLAFAYHIRNYIDQSSIASTSTSSSGENISSLCLVGKDHTQGIKRLLTEEYGLDSRIIEVSGYKVQNKTESAAAITSAEAQCFAKKDRSVHLYLPTEEKHGELEPLEWNGSVVMINHELEGSERSRVDSLGSGGSNPSNSLPLTIENMAIISRQFEIPIKSKIDEMVSNERYDKGSDRS